jgi:lipoprotein-releasing system permease protein
LRIFLINGILLGGLGIISGLIAGSLVIINLQSIARGIEWLFGVSVFSGDVYYLEKIPTVVEPLDIAFIIGMAFVLTILASRYPAWRASKLNPVDILRHA